MTDRRWRGSFCGCGAPGDDRCGLDGDGERMAAGGGEVSGVGVGVCGLAYYLDFSFFFFFGSACRIWLGERGGGMETVFAEPSISGVSDRQASGEFKWLVCVRRRGYPASFLVLGREDKR